jgi:hypothetical protein
VVVVVVADSSVARLRGSVASRRPSVLRVSGILAQS